MGGAACKTIASFVNDASAEQQQALWYKVGEQLRARAAEHRPTWVSTDGTGVHWLHVRLSRTRAHFRCDGYKAPPKAPSVMHAPPPEPRPHTRGGIGGGGGMQMGGGPPMELEEGDIALNCRDCKQAFAFTKGQQDFYAEKGFTNQPSRCKPCNDAKKARMEGGDWYKVREHYQPPTDFAEVCAGVVSEAMDRCHQRLETLAGIQISRHRPLEAESWDASHCIGRIDSCGSPTATKLLSR